jgi:hypothetical protein
MRLRWRRQCAGNETNHACVPHQVSRSESSLLQVKMYWQCAKRLALFRPHSSTRVAGNMPGSSRTSPKERHFSAWPRMCRGSETGDCCWWLNS